VSRPIVSTYRLQLDPTFDLPAAIALVPYLADLGVSHAYLSPVFEAREGSTHGYDVVDPTRVRAELGGRAALDALAADLHERDMGVLLDIVPNHLAADERNPWWWSVLRDGRRSPDAPVFDVDWDAADGRVIVPVLGAPLPEVLDAGDLRVDTTSAEPTLAYFDRRFPLRPDVDTGTPVPDLVAAQHYRLAHWRDPARNVRRFFDIDDLLGVRVEDPDVFERTHALVLELVHAGLVDALRVDHVDGLRDPTAYLERLAAATGVPILVEKILGPGEALPDAWPVQGTTGYEHLAALDRVLVAPTGLAALDRQYLDQGGRPFAAVEHTSRAQVLTDLFPTEWSARSADAAQVLQVDPDVARGAVRALTLGLDVYRTYLASDRPVRPEDADRLRAAPGRVEAHEGRADPDVAAATGRLVDLLTTGDADALSWAQRWQQLSGAVMAKGHEDTAYYRHTRLLALDEVGGDPDGPLAGHVVARFHDHQAARVHRRAGLTVTTTHDTKRSEDARARLLALTEQPDEWAHAFTAFRMELPDDLDLDEARLVAQTLLASWPLDDREWRDYPDRVAGYVRKAMREAKRATSWTDPDTTHEDAVLDAVADLLAGRGVAFDRHFAELRRHVARTAAATALTRVVVQHAVPGAPDVYRGAERWALDLADPDNRRPVDHGRDRSALRAWASTPPDLGDLRRHWADGRIKLWCTWRALRARRARPDLFTRGAATPLTVTGPGAGALVAFERRLGDERAVVVGAIRGGYGATTDGFPLGWAWAGTEVALPDGPPLGDVLRPASGTVTATTAVDELLAELPVALLVGERP
jgi:malto-oligosyltrehalose synthase